MESRIQGSRPRPRTQKNFEAKDRPFQGQGPRTQTLVFSKKKRSSKIFFRRSQRKDLQKIFFKRSLLEETKKKVFADFPQGFWRFPTKFQRFKNSAVLEPRTGQFSRLEASRPRPRTLKCVLEDSTSANHSCIGLALSPPACLILYSIAGCCQARICYNDMRKRGYKSRLCICYSASWLSLFLQLMFLF